MDQNAANFLKERIRRRAQAEGMALSSDEEMYLEMASAGRTQEAHDALKRLKEHESIREFGNRIAGLLMRAYEEDSKTDPQARERYSQSVQAFVGGSSLFSMVSPLMFGYGPSQENHSQQGVSPKPSAPALKLVLVVLILAGLILWMVISRR
jgi:hypothetical protein